MSINQLTNGYDLFSEEKLDSKNLQYYENQALFSEVQCFVFRMIVKTVYISVSSVIKYYFTTYMYSKESLFIMKALHFENIDNKGSKKVKTIRLSKSIFKLKKHPNLNTNYWTIFYHQYFLSIYKIYKFYCMS